MSNKMWLLLIFTFIATSCGSSPEALAKKDAEEMNIALERNDAKAMEKAEANFEKHLRQYQNSDDYFLYSDTYKKYLK